MICVLCPVQVSADLFTKLDYIGRHLRQRTHLPFGGMQIIVVGDFFQLPPVPTKRSDCQCPTCGSQVKQYTKPGSKSSDGTMTSTSFFIFLFFYLGGGAVFAHFLAPPRPIRDVGYALRRARADRVLIGAWNPTL